MKNCYFLLQKIDCPRLEQETLTGERLINIAKGAGSIEETLKCKNREYREVS